MHREGIEESIIGTINKNRNKDIKTKGLAISIMLKVEAWNGLHHAFVQPNLRPPE